MYAHIFRERSIRFPEVCVFDGKLLPQRIDDLEPDRNVTDQFAKLVVAHNEAGFRKLVFPKFT